ncbi:MAG TPA: RDD family protein [Longimicrobium sp.]|jgi:hypothetical protein
MSGYVHATPPPSFDPRRVITQEAFSVAPHLLGLPLARPSRRLAAILLDLLLVAVLANVGGAVLFGLLASIAFFVFASRKLGKGGGFFGRSARFAFRSVGAVILFGVTLSLIHRVAGAFGGDGGDEDGERPAAQQAGLAGGGGQSGDVPKPSLGATIGMIGGMAELEGADDTTEARAAARRMVREMRKMGISDADIRDAVVQAASAGEEGEDGGWRLRAVEGVLPGDSVRPLTPDSLAVLYAAAVGARDSAAADSLGSRLGSALARDSLDELRGSVHELRQSRDELRGELEKERDRGFLHSLLKWLDDLGLGFGWNALYFTAFTALWKGQTPGKRLLGLRVVRLNGQPMTLWMSFERFGGYAAGLLTGLLGFVQVFWDRNRQAIHDKITETVVIRERKDASVPQPAPRPAPSYGAPLGAGGIRRTGP